MNSSKAILFDLDDTLLVEKDSARDSFIETIKSYDLEIDEHEFVKTIREEARKLWHELPTIDYCLRVGISSWEALWADFGGIDENLKLLSNFAGEYRIKSWENALLRFGIFNNSVTRDLSMLFRKIRNTKHIVFPNSVECLEQVKPYYKLGLITNGAPDVQWKKINGSKLKHYFDAIVISGEYGFAKPDPRLFLEALRLLKSTSEHTIMVGDTLKTDIQGAKQTGIRSVWINRDNKKCDDPDLMPDHEIKSLLQLNDVLLLIHF